MSQSKGKIAVGYARVSTGEQVEGISLAAQRTKIRQYAKLHGLRLLAIVEDRGRSGKDLDRPGIRRVFEMIESGRVDAIIVAKLDRATRAGVGALDDLLRRLAKREVRLVSIAESLDTGSASGLFFVRLLALVAQWERETIAERTRDALAELRRQGRRFTRRPPIGFRLKGSRFVRDPKEEATIRMAISLRRRRISIRRIGELLAVQGMTTRSGSPYGKSGVVRLLAAADRQRSAA
jgi:DNA invertase Pin-like site-specific DNA recombinase